MAIHITDNGSGTEGTLHLTNGDYQALKSVANVYGLKDEADVVAFALGVFTKANGKAVVVEMNDGSLVKMMPSDKLLGKA